MLMFAGRLGDRSFAQEDSHGCSACAHEVVGPATSGSANVLINNKPALRTGDEGKHVACCGPNNWVASKGSPRVMINDRKLHRLGDRTVHCGGTGRLVDGSSNVIVGNAHDDNAVTYQGAFVLVNSVTGLPVRGQRYRIVRPNGASMSGVTSAQGRTVLVGTDAPEHLEVEFVD